MKKFKSKIILDIIILLIFLLEFGYLLSIKFIVESRPSLPVMNITISEDSDVWKYFRNNRNLSYRFKEKDLVTIRKKVEKEVDISSYIYKGYDTYLKNGTASGYANFYFRSIHVTEKQSLVGYVWTVAHELIHIKYYNANEMWVNFMTFKILYESEDADFNQAAINNGYLYIACHTYDEDGKKMSSYCPSDGYDIVYYMYQYFNEIL